MRQLLAIVCAAFCLGLAPGAMEGRAQAAATSSDPLSALMGQLGASLKPYQVIVIDSVELVSLTLEGATRATDDNGGSPPAWLDDWKLRLALSSALANPLAARVYASNYDRITVLQQSRRLLPERIIPAMDEHLRIIDAVLAGHEEDAMRAVRAHLAGTLRWWGIGLYEEI